MDPDDFRARYKANDLFLARAGWLQDSAVKVSLVYGLVLFADHPPSVITARRLENLASAPLARTIPKGNVSGARAVESQDVITRNASHTTSRTTSPGSLLWKHSKWRAEEPLSSNAGALGRVKEAPRRGPAMTRSPTSRPRLGRPRASKRGRRKARPGQRVARHLVLPLGSPCRRLSTSRSCR